MQGRASCLKVACPSLHLLKPSWFLVWNVDGTRWPRRNYQGHSHLVSWPKANAIPHHVDSQRARTSLWQISWDRPSLLHKLGKLSASFFSLLWTALKTRLAATRPTTHRQCSCNRNTARMFHSLSIFQCAPFSIFDFANALSKIEQSGNVPHRLFLVRVHLQQCITSSAMRQNIPQRPVMARS